MTDRERLDAILQDIPGDAGSWQALADRCNAILPKHSPSWTLQALVERGDGTVDEMTWGHLRNIARSIRDLAFVLGAADRGDDPDIPF